VHGSMAWAGSERRDADAEATIDGGWQPVVGRAQVRHNGREKGDQGAGMGCGLNLGQGEVGRAEKKRKRKSEIGRLRNFGPKSGFGVLKTFSILLI
jgi:hypothetical protein